VALIGYAQLEDRRRAILAGFDQHVAKPPTFETLERLLEEAPDRERRRNESANEAISQRFQDTSTAVSRRRHFVVRYPVLAEPFPIFVD
jgi:hypothetical protein